jgi:hypothetical protein
MGCNRADARQIGEIDSEDSIELTAEVERLRLIPCWPRRGTHGT